MSPSQNPKFWHIFERPIVGLAPMDGITDAIYRTIQCHIGHPEVSFTEFVPVEAISRGAIRVLPAFITDPQDSITVAQLYGVELESFYQSTILICELGFAGVDINMGCPAKTVTSRGAGAGLILTPRLARDIIKIVRKATLDFANGQTSKGCGLHPDTIAMIATIKARNLQLVKAVEKYLPNSQNQKWICTSDDPISVSVKTRIGFDTPITAAWVGNLLEAAPDNITLHGRTLKQLYRGESDLDEISLASDTIQAFNKSSSHRVTLLGSGDARDKADAIAKSATCHTDGWLIGRASNGNPWVFGDLAPSKSDRINTARIHARLFAQIFPEYDFRVMRKHLCWYVKDFDGASEVRMKLARVNDLDDVNDALAVASTQ